MKVGKPQSKRTPVRLRHKIQKASANKQRKQRKEAKKNPQWRSKLKKDPGIPNLFPYKNRVLAEIEEGRRRKEEEAQRRRDIAKAQRQGGAVAANAAMTGAQEDDDDDEVLLDEDDLDVEDDGDDKEMRSESNPMAALLASAQARAQAHGKDELEEDDENDDDDAEWGGFDEDGSATPGHAAHKTLPKQALADPVKTVSMLLERMQKTQDGLQRLITHYQIPPIATASSDATSRFLVEVARKRGRLGRGGVPNLHAAALTVLGDLNDERLQLPSELAQSAKSTSQTNKGEVQIVTQMAEPFRIEGLFGDDTLPEVVKSRDMLVDI
jgi:nuclear GTP-binding protein